MRDLEGTTLAKILTEQYNEADTALQRRLPVWLYILDCWRGEFRDENYYNRKNMPKNLAYAFGQAERLKRENQAFDIYFREIFRVVEGFLSRIDRAYLTSSRPFSLNPPTIIRDPNINLAERKAKLAPVEEWLCYEYRKQSIPDRQIRTMRDACLCDIGYSVVGTNLSKWYPVADIKRFEPWNVYPDPYEETAATWKYAAYRDTKTLREAINIYPEAEEEIKNHKIKDDYRESVQFLHFIGTYGSEVEELDDLTKDKLVDIVVLAQKDGEPSNIVLEWYENPWQMIPIQDFTMLRDPEECGPYGVSLGSTVEDEQEAVNIIGNRAIQQLEYATLQGGFFDSAFSTDLKGGLLTPKPGEWLPFPGSNKTMSEIFFPMKYPDFSGQHFGFMDRLRTEEGRKTGQQDFNYGISTPTATNTLGETNMLMSESNEIFRAKAQRLDASFERLYKMYVLVTAYALKRYQEAGELDQMFIRKGDEIIPLDPTVFDEEYEVNLTAGAQNIDGPQKAMKELLYVEKGLTLGAPIDTGKAFRDILTKDNIDPDNIMPTQAELQAQQAQAAMAMMAMAAAQGTPQGAVSPSSGNQAGATPPPSSPPPESPMPNMGGAGVVV